MTSWRIEPAAAGGGSGVQQYCLSPKSGIWQSPPTLLFLRAEVRPAVALRMHAPSDAVVFRTILHAHLTRATRFSSLGNRAFCFAILHSSPLAINAGAVVHSLLLILHCQKGGWERGGRILGTGWSAPCRRPRQLNLVFTINAVEPAIWKKCDDAYDVLSVGRQVAAFIIVRADDKRLVERLLPEKRYRPVDHPRYMRQSRATGHHENRCTAKALEGPTH
jgi:hypothetical protein